MFLHSMWIVIEMPNAVLETINPAFKMSTFIASRVLRKKFEKLSHRSGKRNTPHNHTHTSVNTHNNKLS